MSPSYAPGIIGALGIAALTLLGAGKPVRAHDHATLDRVSLPCGQLATVASVPQWAGGPARFAGACQGPGTEAEMVVLEGCQITCLGPAKRVPGFGGVMVNEFQPWLPTRHVVSAAKAVVYFTRGYQRQRTDDSFHGQHFFLAMLSFQGWNIIGAQVPRNVSYTRADPPRISDQLQQCLAQLLAANSISAGLVARAVIEGSDGSRDNDDVRSIVSLDQARQHREGNEGLTERTSCAHPLGRAPRNNISLSPPGEQTVLEARAASWIM